MTSPISDEEAYAITRKCMTDTTTFVIRTDIKHAWLMVSWLQLVYRHPGIGAPMKNQIRKAAEFYTNAIEDLHPEAIPLLAMGWNPQYDRGEEK